MAQTGYTPIILFKSGTASNVPTTSNLAVGELAINYADGKLYYNTGSAIKVLAGSGGAGVVAGSNTQVQYNNSGAFGASANLTYDGTSFSVIGRLYNGSASTFGSSTWAMSLGNGGVSANYFKADSTYWQNSSGTQTMQLSGGTLTLANDASINSLTVGLGNSAISSNTAFGNSALSANTTGSASVAVGYQSLKAQTSGYNNNALGFQALFNNTTGASNNAFGQGALKATTTGSNNSAFGDSALQANTTANNNTAVGYQAAYSNQTGSAVVAIGNSASYSNTSGGTTVAVGNSALYTNSTSTNLVGVGYRALYNITTANSVAIGANAGYATTGVGGGILAIGTNALTANTTGNSNTAVGTQYNTSAALAANTTGSYNIAVGEGSLSSNTTASQNTAVGYQAGYSNTTNGSNTFFGYQAGLLSTGYRNTFIGMGNLGGSGSAVTSGYSNVILGGYTGNQGGLDIRTLSNYIVLSDGDGNPRLLCDASGDVIIPGGGTTISQAGTFTIYGTIVNQNVLNVISTNTSASQYILNLQSNATIANTAALIRGYSNTSTNVFFVAGNGNVTNTNNSYGAISDVKLKENIVDATPKLADLMKVQIRQYNLKAEQTHKQIGVIAQEIEQVFPAMVEETPDRDEKGNDLGTTTKSVKYSVFVPMLVKAMQEQQALIESLTTRLAALEAK